MPAQALPATHRTRVLALVAAALMVVAMIPLARTSPAEAQTTSVTLEADDNVGAAVAWSEQTFPDGAPEVLLTRQDAFPDALASGGAQGVLGAPLLMTDREQLSEETDAELQRLGAERVTILGGENAVSAEVEAALVADGYAVDRLRGPTRIETAIDIAGTVLPEADTVILARARGAADGSDETQGFADSLAAGGWAAAEGWPVLLTETNELSDPTEDYLESAQVERVIVVGGQGAVNETVVLELRAAGYDVERVAGPAGTGNRASTAVAIAEARGYANANEAPGVILIEGYIEDAYASGFPAAAYSGLNDAPIVLANGDELPPETEEWLGSGDPSTTARLQECPGGLPLPGTVCGIFGDDASASPSPSVSPRVSTSTSPRPSASASATARPTQTAATSRPSPSPSPDQMLEIVCGPFTSEVACDRAEALVSGDIEPGDEGGSPSPTGTGTTGGTPTPTEECDEIPIIAPCPDPSPSGTATASPTGTATASPTGTATATPTGTASATPTGTASPTATTTTTPPANGS